ncbi:MAG TPA: DUF2269 family protein [Actinomycetota bacterium]|nr:DUF2269 family protein [Actinomycetota bacterium]
MIADIGLYTVIKFIHIFAAIVAVGFNASYGIWLARAAREPQHELHVLRGIKILDDRWANPAYGVLLVTGVVNVFVGDWSFTTFWIATSLGLFLVLGAMGFFLYTPTLRRQIEVIQTEGPNSETYKALANRGRTQGIIMAVIVTVIIFLMVTKPTL